MKNLAVLSFSLFCFLLPLAPHAAVPDEQAASSSVTQVCDELRGAGATQEQLAKSGCCSWHQGVCGCTSGRVVCCDDTFSPSCTCNKEESITVPN